MRLIAIKRIDRAHQILRWKIDSVVSPSYLNLFVYSNTSLSLQQSSTDHIKKQSHLNIIWFNPLVVAQFQHFPPSNKFRNSLNRNNVKVRSCCTQNIVNIIKSHSKKLIGLTIKIHSHAALGKKKTGRWRGNAKLKT